MQPRAASRRGVAARAEAALHAQLVLVSMEGHGAVAQALRPRAAPVQAGGASGQAGGAWVQHPASRMDLQRGRAQEPFPVSPLHAPEGRALPASRRRRLTRQGQPESACQD